MYFVILWLTFALDLTRAEIDAHYLFFFLTRYRFLSESFHPEIRWKSRHESGRLSSYNVPNPCQRVTQAHIITFLIPDRLIKERIRLFQLTT